MEGALVPVDKRLERVVDSIQQRIFGEDAFRQIPGLAQERHVSQKVGETDVGQTALQGAEDIAGTAQAEVGFGDLETIGGLFEYPEFFHGFGVFAVC